MNVILVTIMVFIGVVIVMLAGLPIAFSLGGLALIFSIFLWGPEALFLSVTATLGTMDSFLLTAVPLFIFMGYILESSRIGDDLYRMMHVWMGSVRGGLAIGTVFICTIFAAMAGISGASTVTMGVVALPAMLKRRYQKEIALGCIGAGGALGILIPPSIPMVLYASVAGVSVGKMLLGGFFPGFLLSSLFIAYIAIRCAIQKELGPPLPASERAGWLVKISSLKAVIFPIIIILCVLGSIYTGAATPTEAAALGCVSTMLAAGINRRLTWENLKYAVYNALRTSGMVLWIVVGASAFASMYSASGGSRFVTQTLTAAPVDRYVIIVCMQLIIMFLGCLMDPGGIILLCTPIFLPVITALGFDPIWFGVIFTVNLEMAYLTPPLGYNLFYLKGVAPPGIAMADIIRSVLPFLGLQALGLVLVMVFPEIAMWLPNKMLVAG